MIRINAAIELPERELELRAIRSPGPGGQNVNKVATAIQLRFDIRASPSLTPAVRERLEQLAGNRLTRDGVLVLTAHRFRSLEANRRDVLDRLVRLIRRAASEPKRRRATRPPPSVDRRRLEEKRRRAQLKRSRRRPADD